MSAAYETYANDFTGSGVSDILWQQGNELGIWVENGSLGATWSVLSPNENGWSVIGTGDYTGSGINDILWGQGNEVGVWVENGSLGATWHLISPNTNGWTVVGDGDYNGGSTSDILWQYGSGTYGELGIWLMNSSLNPTWELLSNQENGWSVIGSGDYTGNGISDILWGQGNQVGVWVENSSLNPTWHLISPNTNGWSVVGSGDLTGNGIDDIIWQYGSGTYGELGTWLMNGSLNPTWELLSNQENGWTFAGTADLLRNGVDDILWKQGNELGVWIENSSLNPTWYVLSPNTNGWTITGSGTGANASLH